MDDDEDLVAGYGDLERVNVGIGVGNLIVGKNKRLQYLIRAQELTPQQKFLQAVESASLEANVGFSKPLFDEIANRHPHPEYLNAKVALYAVDTLVNRDARPIRLKPWSSSIGTKLNEASISHLDAYRYADMIVRYLS